jgi:murein DD-endopeptidase MepM/ murein hydrolase activator NlpD
MVAPFSGWSEIVSFVDHDRPDYEQDGRIVIANGLAATSSAGQSSDLFPSYWSPALRQYLNYDGHNGYDFDISYQPVLAAASGVVEFAGWNSNDVNAGYGQMILINHRNGYVTLYGHLSKLDVSTGDRVHAGQEIGISGTTGHSSGPHLHFSVFHDCNVTDPYGWNGRGQDPLYLFDGERAQYLWLPDHEPMILNTPPGWPVEAFGVHVPSLGYGSLPGAVSAVDRLLLLALPAARPANPVSPGVALAGTDADVTSEALTLVPALDRLVARGLIQNYQLVRAAAAVWVRGTASAEQLEKLPGVASLTGVTTRDLAAAESGLAHAVLIQIGQRQAPSLWPLRFRSALHAWQPTMSTLRGHALVAGFALPGGKVAISLHRGRLLAGQAVTVGDPQTGGFVTMIHDSAGDPVGVQAGDSMEVASGARTSLVKVEPLTVRARRNGVTGTAPVLSTVSVFVRSPTSSKIWTTLASASRVGTLSILPPLPLRAGSLSVTSVVDDAGNQESASGFVPGVVVTQNGSIVHGWAVGHAPHLQLSRQGRVLYSREILPEPDGTFQLRLVRDGHPLVVRSGDTLTIGSKAHGRSIQVPKMSTRATVTFPSGDEVVTSTVVKRPRAHTDLVRDSGAKRARATGVRNECRRSRASPERSCAAAGRATSP